MVRAQGAGGSAWHKNDLAAVVLFLIEQLVAQGGLFQCQAMGNDQFGLKAACLDMLQQFGQVLLDMAGREKATPSAATWEPRL